MPINFNFLATVIELMSLKIIIYFNQLSLSCHFKNCFFKKVLKIKFCQKLSVMDDFKGINGTGLRTCTYVTLTT